MSESKTSNRFNNLGRFEETNCSVYDYFVKNNRYHFMDDALVYFGKTLKYSDIFNKIDIFAKLLRCAGVKKGDKVIVSLPSIPEAVYLFYAVNKIGAIYCGMDCRCKSGEVEDIIKSVCPKICFVSDFHIKEFRNCVNIPIVYIRATETIGGITRFFGAFAHFFTGRYFVTSKINNMFHFQSFYSSVSEPKSVSEVKTYGEDICACFYTSGTTYGRKCVVLTNHNINSAIYQHANADINFKRGEVLTNIMPFFTCYGVTLGTHLPLCLGIKVNLVPLFFGKNMKKLLLKSKSNYIITVPAHWEHFVNDSFENCNLKFFKAAIVGGDSISAEFYNKINSIFKKCYSDCRFMNGYGLTETTSSAVSPTIDTPQGSIGKELSHTLVRIFDADTSEPCKIGEKGEICISGPSVCQGYLNDKEATDRLLKIHQDGRVWLHSGDLGYVDENGFVYFCERIKRMFVNFDGTKISPYSIEKVILKCDEVKACLIQAVKDKHHSHGKCAKAIIVLNNSRSVEAQNACKKFIVDNLPEHMRPVEIMFVDSLPITKNGKVDYFGE